MTKKECYGLKDMYKFYKNKLTKKERKNSDYKDYAKFRDIIKDFNSELTKMIIEEGVEFKMPARMGFLRIKKYKNKVMLKEDGTIDKNNLSVDWDKTTKLWAKEYPGKSRKELKEIKDKKLIYHLNEHTDGYKYMLYWNKKGSNAINRSIYSIIFTFWNNRYFAKILKSDMKVSYFE